MRTSDYICNRDADDRQKMNRCCMIVTLMSKFAVLLVAVAVFMLIRYLD